MSCLLWAAVHGCEAYLLYTPDRVPNLYESGVRWQREVPTYQSGCGGPGQEKFLGPRQVLAQGHADCEDVATWRCAELRTGKAPPRFSMAPLEGHPRPTVLPSPWGGLMPRFNALPAFFVRESAPGIFTYHIVVFWPDGRFEDPSRTLGMGRRYG